VITELNGHPQSLTAHGDGPVGVPLHPAHRGQRGQHLAQLGPIVELPGQDLGLAQEGAAPAMLAHRERHSARSQRSSMAKRLVSWVVGRWASASIARSKAVTASGNPAWLAAWSPACRQ
jgi:hypothetical protein